MYTVQLDLFSEQELEALETKPDINQMPFYAEPRTDNEKLFNWQREYYGGDREALFKIWNKILTIAPRLVNIECGKHRLKITKERMQELGEDAVMIYIKAVKKNNLVIYKSFIAYIRLQVLRAMFYMTKAQKFEKWLKRKKYDNFFMLSDFDKEYIKEQFERECGKHAPKAEPDEEGK